MCVGLEYLFTALFTFELIWNMFCNWFWDFFLSGWNIFDLVVVLTSLISAVLGLSNIKSVRMLRALRVVRLVKQMQNLRIIVNAVVASIIPVAWAFMVCFMVVAVYAIMGQSFFGDEFPQYYDTLGQSLFTLFSVATMEGWLDVAADMMTSETPGAIMGVKQWSVIYLLSFIFVVSYIMTSVVVAVLLENFSEAARVELRKSMESAHEDEIHSNVLDPILNDLAKFGNEQELTTRILELFELLDMDDSGLLSMDEMVQGLLKLNVKPPIRMSEEDFDIFTLGRSLCVPAGGESLSPDGFELAIRIEIKGYLCRQLGYAVKISGLQDYFALGFAAMHQIMIDLDPGSRQKSLEQSLLFGQSDDAGGGRGVEKEEDSRRTSSTADEVVADKRAQAQEVLASRWWHAHQGQQAGASAAPHSDMTAKGHLKPSASYRNELGRMGASVKTMMKTASLGHTSSFKAPWSDSSDAIGTEVPTAAVTEVSRTWSRHADAQSRGDVKQVCHCVALPRTLLWK